MIDADSSCNDDDDDGDDDDDDDDDDDEVMLLLRRPQTSTNFTYVKTITLIMTHDSLFNCNYCKTRCRTVQSVSSQYRHLYNYITFKQNTLPSNCRSLEGMQLFLNTWITWMNE